MRVLSLIAAIILGTVVSSAIAQEAQPAAAQAARPIIGVVDMGYILKNHPTMKTEIEAIESKMKAADDSWENIMGEKLTPPLRKAAADIMAMIVETNGKKTRLGTILSDTAGKTHLYFKGGSKDPSFFYHSWTGSDWHTTSMTDSKISDADFFIGKDQKIKLLVTEQLGDMGEIAWWTTKDDGINWDKGAPLLSVKKANLEMSALIRNAHPDAQVIVAEIPNDPISLYSKLYLLGDAGPVSRKQPQRD